MELLPPQFDRWFEPEQTRELSRALGDSPAVAQLRGQAFEAYRELELEPNPLYRKYSYFLGADLTGVTPVATGPAVPAPEVPEMLVRIIHDAAGTRVEVPPVLRETGLEVRSLADLWTDGPDRQAQFFEGIDPWGPRGDKLEALTLAFVNRGVQLHVPDRFPLPVRVQELTVFSRPGEALSVRRKIRAGAETRLIFSEEVYAQDRPEGQRLYGSLTELEAGAGAQVAYVTVHAPDDRVVASYSRRGSAGPRSRLAWVWAGYGGFRSKTRSYSDLPGQGSDVEDLQSFYGNGQQSYDSYVQITHVGTDTRGQSVTRGVFRDEARGTSRGMARMEKDARRTVSFLSEHAMLLSRGARSNTIPVLEILCRDVKATHSSSVAPVDPERVFYLESRGIPEAEAVRMIGEGFLATVLDRAPVAELRDLLYPQLTARWEGRLLRWGAEDFAALPPLQFSGAGAGPEWRFDTKLR